MVRQLSTLIFLCLFFVGSACAVGLDDVRDLVAGGQYEAAASIAREQVERGIWNEHWPRLLIECQLTLGRYEDARSTYETAVKRYPTSLSLRLLGLDAYRFTGDHDAAIQANSDFIRLLTSSPSRYASRDNRVAAGRFLAMRGEDARQILELFYDQVRDADPEFLEAYLATAELAIDKGDFQVAAQTLARAEQLAPKDPRVAYLSSQAWATSDATKSAMYLEKALQLNPNHVSSLIAKAESAIDAEQYEEAYRTIKRLLSVNIHDADGWALLAVLAHLEGRFEIESLMRAAALGTWSRNPRVDHRIGKKLSQKYRFAEGAQYQRQAIEADSGYEAASFQLAQDLLRLGQDETGWILAKQVSESDPYNVIAHNLMTLNDRLSEFTRIKSDGIEVRMDATEAQIYGDEVMNLLREAKLVLCEEYDVQPDAPIVVEIFPEQKDFAIRTFGLPGGAGYLGVCFGRVITANSPASQGESPTNWQSVLWHEFCHVVTLEKTKNRMPRWLSEGISVYEERNRNPSWGESMTPKYREMILGEDLTPVSDLSSAFLNPKSAMHLQFAYYESSLVVEYLVETYGIDAIKDVLNNLADGLSTDDAFAGNFGSAQKLDRGFEAYARRIADSFAPDAKWDRLEVVEGGKPRQPGREEVVAWIDANPENYWALMASAASQIDSGKFTDARKTLEKVRDFGAVTGHRGGALEMLARVYRELGESESERETLREIVKLSDSSLTAIERLIDIAREERDWNKVLRHGEQFLAIQPLITTGHEAVVDAAEHLDAPALAIRSLNALALLDPVDPAGLDYRTAKALHQLHRNLEAKRYVLQALVEAPRYRAAHRLLLKLESGESK